MTQFTLEQIHCFPVKGFPGQMLNETTLIQGRGIPNDRRFAITKGVTADGRWMPARSYYINSTTDGLLTFEITFDPQEDTLVLTNSNGKKLALQPGQSNAVEKANQSLPELLEHIGVDSDLPPPQIVELTGPVANWDYPDTPISIINLETVNAVSRKIGKPLDVRRFRGNLIISGLPAWQEFSLIGKSLQIGDSCHLEVLRPIDRCPAPGVNPDTGERDIPVAELLVEHYGHVFCGMYAKVIKSGSIQTASPIAAIEGYEIDSSSEANGEGNDYRLWPRPVKISGYEAEGEIKRIALTSSSNLPLFEANPGQRIRIHFGEAGWTAEHVTDGSKGSYILEVEKSQTGDPLTEHLRTGLELGQELVISGPFGRAR